MNSFYTGVSTFLNIAYQAFLNLLMIEGFVALCYLFLVLLQLVLCRDATEANTSKLLNRPLKVRWRLFKRSLHDNWYKASLGLFISVCILLSRLGYEFIHNIGKPTPLIIFHGVFWPCLGWLYYQRGYKAIFFVKLGQFLNGETD